MKIKQAERFATKSKSTFVQVLKTGVHHMFAVSTNLDSFRGIYISMIQGNPLCYKRGKAHFVTRVLSILMMKQQSPLMM